MRHRIKGTVHNDAQEGREHDNMTCMKFANRKITYRQYGKKTI
jgi:hypothetical protein